ARSIHQLHADEPDHVHERSRAAAWPSSFARTGMASRYSNAGASAPAKHATRIRSSQRNLLLRRARDNDARDYRRDSFSHDVAGSDPALARVLESDRPAQT